MNSFKNIKRIFSDELNVIFNDHSILLTIIVAPMLYLFFLGSIYLNKEIEEVPIAIVDMDKTPVTRQLIRMVDASPKLKIVQSTGNMAEAKDLYYKMEAQGILYFPKNFGKKLKRLEGADAGLYLNNSRFMPSNTINEGVQTALLTVGAGVRIKYFMTKGLIPKLAYNEALPIRSELKPMYNTTNNYGDFLLPGLFLLILQQTLLIGLGESIASENEKYGGLKSGSKTDFVSWYLGKSGFYLLLFFAFAFFTIETGFRAFDLIPIRSTFAAWSLYVPFILATVNIGMIIGSYFKKQILLMEILAFSSYPFFLVSGYSWPAGKMILPLQFISKLIPISPMLDGIKRVFIMRGHFSDITGQVLHLWVLFGLSLIWLVYRFYVTKLKRAIID